LTLAHVLGEHTDAKRFRHLVNAVCRGGSALPDIALPGRFGGRGRIIWMGKLQEAFA